MSLELVKDGQAEVDKSRDELRKLQSNIQVILEAQTFIAHVTKTKFDALVKEGFTPQQALELVK